MQRQKQQELRSLLKAEKAKKATINSPFAKYRADGQLTCILCKGEVIKAESLWDSHCASPTHKQHLIQFVNAKKQLQQQQSQTQNAALKNENKDEKVENNVIDQAKNKPLTKKENNIAKPAPEPVNIVTQPAVNVLLPAYGEEEEEETHKPILNKKSEITKISRQVNEKNVKKEEEKKISREEYFKMLEEQENELLQREFNENNQNEVQLEEASIETNVTIDAQTNLPTNFFQKKIVTKEFTDAIDEELNQFVREIQKEEEEDLLYSNNVIEDDDQIDFDEIEQQLKEEEQIKSQQYQKINSIVVKSNATPNPSHPDSSLSSLFKAKKKRKLEDIQLSDEDEDDSNWRKRRV